MLVIAIQDNGYHQNGHYTDDSSPTGELLAMLGDNLDAVLDFQRKTVAF
jgi:hypothetical protein